MDLYLEMSMFKNIFRTFRNKSVEEFLKLSKEFNFEKDVHTFDFMLMCIRYQFNDVFKYLLEKTKTDDFLYFESLDDKVERYKNIHYFGRYIYHSNHIVNDTSTGLSYYTNDEKPRIKLSSSSSSTNVGFTVNGVYINIFGEIENNEEKLVLTDDDKEKLFKSKIIKLLNFSIAEKNDYAVKCILDDDRFTLDEYFIDGYLQTTTELKQDSTILLFLHHKKVSKISKNNGVKKVIFNNNFRVLKKLLKEEYFTNDEYFDLNKTNVNSILSYGLMRDSVECIKLLYNDRIIKKYINKNKLVKTAASHYADSCMKFLLTDMSINFESLKNSILIDSCCDSYRQTFLLLINSNRITIEDSLAKNILKYIADNKYSKIFVDALSSKNLDVFLDNMACLCELLKHFNSDELIKIAKKKPIKPYIDNYFMIRRAISDKNIELFKAVVNNKLFETDETINELVITSRKIEYLKILHSKSKKLTLNDENIKHMLSYRDNDLFKYSIQNSLFDIKQKSSTIIAQLIINWMDDTLITLLEHPDSSINDNNNKIINERIKDLELNINVGNNRQFISNYRRVIRVKKIKEFI